MALLLLSVTIVFAACNAGEDSGNNGDFVINIYTGADEVGVQSISFDELVANEDRPILLNFWAGNCPPCRAEMPTLEATWREYRDQVLFVGVDIGPYVGLGSYREGKSLAEEFGITYVTGNTDNRSVVPEWQVASMPSTFLLNSDGRIHNTIIGAISLSRLSQEVRGLIAANAR